MTQPAPTTTPAAPLIDAYFVFCGGIDQDAAKRIIQALTIATNPVARIGHVHFLFQSTGGTIADAVCLYNFIRALPVDLTIYNVGSVQSAGVIVYLGAKRRRTSAHATFMVHRTGTAPQSATAQGLQALTKSVALDDARTETILKSRVKLTDEEWANLDRQILWFSAEEAVKNGLADEVAEFAPPKGSQIYNV